MDRTERCWDALANAFTSRVVHSGNDSRSIFDRYDEAYRSAITACSWDHIFKLWAL